MSAPCGPTPVNPQPFFELWVYLAATPLAGLTMTLVAYAIGWWCYARTGMHPLANPVLIAVVLIVGVLAATGTSYQTYFDGAQFVHFLLGPAVVGLAVPLVREWGSVRAARGADRGRAARRVGGRAGQRGRDCAGSAAPRRPRCIRSCRSR